jgi:hypothetical protein
LGIVLIHFVLVLYGTVIQQLPTRVQMVVDDIQTRQFAD